MSSRAFIAREGWEQTPIPKQQWQAAAATRRELQMVVPADGGEPRAMLRGSQRRHLSWHDGVVHAYFTNTLMAGALFALAEQLQAQVYDERRRPYRDLRHWQERHARRARMQHQRHDHSRKAAKMVLSVLLVIAVGFVALLVWVARANL